MIIRASRLLCSSIVCGVGVFFFISKKIYYKDTEKFYGGGQLWGANFLNFLCLGFPPFSITLQSKKTVNLWLSIRFTCKTLKTWEIKKPLKGGRIERKMGLEPTTPTLARSCSTN